MPKPKKNPRLERKQIAHHVDVLLQPYRLQNMDISVRMTDIQESHENLLHTMDGAAYSLNEIRQLRANVDEQIARFHKRLEAIESALGKLNSREDLVKSLIESVQSLKSDISSE